MKKVNCLKIGGHTNEASFLSCGNLDGLLQRYQAASAQTYGEHPECRVTSAHSLPFGFAYYPPSDWLKENEGAIREDWTKWCEANKEEALERWPYYSDLKLKLNDEQYLSFVGVDGVDVSLLEKEEVDILMPEGHQSSASMRLLEQMLTLNDKVIEQLRTASDELFNHPCQQMQPGAWLGNVNRTILVGDSCTDALQGYLDEGWRILAIQPQPDQRRPDYILGRYDMDHKPTGRGAERG